jgi:hypothetical protein
LQGTQMAQSQRGTKVSEAPEATRKKQTGAPPFKPGQSGNPNGRPKGSRNKLGEEFIQKLYADFQEHGEAAIVQVRQERPDAYLKVIAGLLPKELKITNESDLTDDQLIERIQQLDDIIRPFLGAERASSTSGGDEPSAVTH